MIDWTILAFDLINSNVYQLPEGFKRMFILSISVLIDFLREKLVCVGVKFLDYFYLIYLVVLRLLIAAD